jgi:hypothetical protein
MEITLEECKKYINYGMILRLISTIIAFAILHKFIDNKYIKKYIFLILAILLTLLDLTDGSYDIIYKYNGYYGGCSKTYYYQIIDKIIDVISYSLLFVFFKFKICLLLFIVLYRIIGVIIFTITQQKMSVVVFFDFVKEYLLYLFVFGKNYTYLPFCIFVKILYEYYIHIIHTNKWYKYRDKLITPIIHLFRNKFSRLPSNV